MNALLDFVIRNRALTIFVVLLLGALGVRAAQQIPIDAVPDVTNTQVQVLTNAPALGPVEIEQYVTVPVEAAMSGLPGVEEVRSLSRTGLSAVTVVFDEGTDIYHARQLVSERLSEAREAIPEGYGAPELGPLSTGLGEIYQFEVRGTPMCPPPPPPGFAEPLPLSGGGGESTETSTHLPPRQGQAPPVSAWGSERQRAQAEHRTRARSQSMSPQATGGAACFTPMELRGILDWYVAYQLRPIEGVVEVNAFGGELETWEVQVEPARLTALGLSLRDVFDALEANNANAGGGVIVRGAEQRVVRGEGLVTSLQDVRDIVVATRDDDTPIYVGDLGEVRLAPMLRQGAVTRDGRGEVVTGTVMMLMGANAGQVTEAVEARIEALEPGLPEGVTIEPWYDRSELVDRTVRTVATNLIEGGVLVVVVLLLLLGNLRAGLLVAAVIPLAMAITFIAMQWLGISGNLMSLGALDFGLIIDGAIVLIESIVRRLGETGAKGRAVDGVIREAARRVARPVIFGTAIIMIVYVPILTLQGIEGKMFRPMAITALSALTAALVLAILLMPAGASLLFRGGVSEREPLLARAARAAYQPLLNLTMRARTVTVVAALVCMGAGAWLASTMGAEFIPRLDEGAIAMQAVRPPSVSLDESIAATTRIEQSLLEHFPDEIDTIVSRTGRAEIATDPMGIEVSDIYVMLTPTDQWTHADTKDELVAAIEAVLADEVPGQNISFSQPIELRTNELISGVRSDVAVNLYGPDLEQLERLGEQLMAVVRQVDGAADVTADPVAGLPDLRVVVDRQAAARYGLNASDVLAAVSSIGGHQVGVVFDGEQRHALQVRLAPEARRDRAAIADLLIAAPGGERVPLSQVALIVEDEGPAVISRSSAQRRRTIQVNVRGRDLAGFVAAAQEAVRGGVEMPPGYFVTWGGQFENLQAASARLAIAVPAALLLILLLLYTTFGALRPALIIYLNIPMAAVGGVVALYVRGMPLSISAAVGFIALSGIAVLNGVVMVSAIRDLQREGIGLYDATMEGARSRLRPVLMTALTDGIGFLPMAISTTAGAEVQRPLATVVIGGLVTSTLLTLFVLPAVYSLLGGRIASHEEPA